MYIWSKNRNGSKSIRSNEFYHVDGIESIQWYGILDNLKSSRRPRIRRGVS